VKYERRLAAQTGLEERALRPLRDGLLTRRVLRTRFILAYDAIADHRPVNTTPP